MDIIKAMPDPSKHPKFLKQHRSQSRPTTLSDFCRPVQTPAEHSLFMQYHMQHTNQKSKRTDWLGLTREFNLAVTRSWKQTHELADLFLKHESHPKQYEKQLVMQASLAEVAQTISGLQANPGPSHGAAQAQVHGMPSAPAQGLQLGQGNANFQPPRSGSGGPGGSRECERCSGLFNHRVEKAEHRCFLYMCSQGYNAQQLAEQGFRGPPVSKAEADKQLEKKNWQAAAQKKRRMH